MRFFILCILCFFTFLVEAQVRKPKTVATSTTNQTTTDNSKPLTTKRVATIDLYRFISLDQDTTYIDTSLTIQKEYSHNYLRRDTFGLLPMPNDGQSYNTLQYSSATNSMLPEFGFKAKHFNFIEAHQVRYASVATPVTELYFKSTQSRGQSVDSYLTLNTAPNLNFSIAYRGLRSQGKYINQLASTGNFRFTMSYNTKNLRYFNKTHFTQQDIMNQENGGITNLNDFESENIDFNNRQRLEVFLTDAKSLLKGNRIFIDHSFRINPKSRASNLYLNHQFNYENKFFEYGQATVLSSSNGTPVARFGDSFRSSEINDTTRFNKMYNKLGVSFENTTLGRFHFFTEDFRSNYFYNQILFFDRGVVPNLLHHQINTVGGQYVVQKKKWRGNFRYTTSLTNDGLSDLEASVNYDLNDQNQFVFKYQNSNKLPNANFNLHQSSYMQYNWFNNFNNEKINRLSATAITPFVTASAEFTVLNDYLLFKEVSTASQKLNQTQIVAPFQYGGTINHLSIKLNREFKFGKFGLDNTILYQKVVQDEDVLNVPEIVARNSIFFSNHFFKKALFLQTGFVLNYFTSFYGNEYNPVIGEFFVQRDTKIGDFPLLDFFVNAKIQRTRIYFKAEHFNSSLTGNSFYASPNNPYRDLTIRFGLIWNFFE